jgi:hypothetical protein
VPFKPRCGIIVNWWIPPSNYESALLLKLFAIGCPNAPVARNRTRRHFKAFLILPLLGVFWTRCERIECVHGQEDGEAA